MKKAINTRTSYRIIGSDYSAQEPRMSTFISDEPKMYEAYTTGKDLYAIIAQSAFNNNYEDNLEFYPEGTELEIDGKKVIAGKKTHLNKAGKERRSTGKTLNLAATYGMGGPTAGARLGYTGDEAKKKGTELLNNFFTGFPLLKKAIDDSKASLKKCGYVEDFVGRRRRLPEINLPAYVVSLLDQNVSNFNPFLECKDRTDLDPKIITWQGDVAKEIAKSQEAQKKRCLKEGTVWTPNDEMSNKTYQRLYKDALKDGVLIQANTGLRAQAERQCFNARIQGSAASLTKIAMVDIFNSQALKDLDAKLIITVHDEVLVECPSVYADKVEKLLPEIMVNAAKEVGDDVPQACDPYNVNRWYADTEAAAILDEFKKLEKGNKDKGIAPLSRDDALKRVIENHPEIPEQAIINTIETGCDLIF